METCRSSTTRRRIHNCECEGVQIGVAERIIKHVRLRSDQTIKGVEESVVPSRMALQSGQYQQYKKKQVRAMLIASESRLNAKVGVIRHHVVRRARCWHLEQVMQGQREELRCQDGRVRHESDVQNTRCKPEQGLMTDLCVPAIWLVICSDESLVWCLFPPYSWCPTREAGTWSSTTPSSGPKSTVQADHGEVDAEVILAGFTLDLGHFRQLIFQQTKGVFRDLRHHSVKCCCAFGCVKPQLLHLAPILRCRRQASDSVCRPLLRSRTCPSDPRVGWTWNEQRCFLHVSWKFQRCSARMCAMVITMW